jgi:hypothetical protein
MSESRRDAVWTAAGWLGIIFGGIGVLVSLGMLGLVLLFVVGNWIEAAPQRSFSLLEYLSSLGVGLLPLLCLLAASSAFGAGLGLLRRRLYGRTLTFVFGAYSIIAAAFSTVDLWQSLLSHAVNGPSIASRLLRVVAFTPMYLGYAIAMALLCRSVYSHREAFDGGRSSARLTTE